LSPEKLSLVGVGPEVRPVVCLQPTTGSLTGMCVYLSSLRGMRHFGVVLATLRAAFTLPGLQHPVWGLVKSILERVVPLKHSIGRQGGGASKF